MTATSYINTYVGYSASATSVDLLAPTGTQDNDIMFAIICGQDPSTTPPSGWTLLSTGVTKYRCFYRIANSESGSYNFTQTTLGKIRGQVACYRGGFNTSDPIDAVSDTAYTTFNTTLRAASFSVSVVDSNILFIGAAYDPATAHTFTPPTNPGAFTEDVDSVDTDSDFAVTFARYYWSGSGATGNIDATIDSTENDKHAFAVSLKPSVNYTLEITGGSFSYSGASVDITSDRNLSVTGGSFSYSGASVDISLYIGPPTITSISSGSVGNGDTLTITGTKFGATQSSSDVELCPAASLSGGVQQTILSWSDTEIQIKIVRGSITFGTRYLVVRRNLPTDAGEFDSNFYPVLLVKASVLEYKDIINNGGGRIAHLWHVGGYPWAVTDDAGLIDALSNYGADEVVQAARKRIFGTNEWTGAGFGTVTPAYHVPIFPTMIRDFGNVSWRMDEAGGIIDGGNWTVKIEDRDLGHTWDHAVAGDEIWGLDGLHRVANLQDSVVNGWGLLSEKLLRNIGGTVPMQIGVEEQSGSVLYDRVGALTGDDYVTVWVNHEAIAVDAVDGTFPEYYMDICGLGNLDAGRGLYRSRPQDHHMGRLVGLDPAIADVPGSVIGKYCWLYSIPLTDDDQLRVNGYGEPIIVEELRGVVSPNVSTENNVTTIPIRNEFAAVEDRINIEASKAVETNLRGFVFTRGDVPSDDLVAIRTKWQQPHLTICEFDFGYYDEIQGALSGITYSKYYKNQFGDSFTTTGRLVYTNASGQILDNDFVFWKEHYIWICGRGETITFETVDDVIDALNAELEACYIGREQRNSKETFLSHYYHVENLEEYGPALITAEYIGDTSESMPAFISKTLTSYITGPLAWVFNLGVPLYEEINIYTLFNDLKNGSSFYDPWEIMETCAYDKVLPLTSTANNSNGRYWMRANKNYAAIQNKDSLQGGNINSPIFYIGYPWNSYPIQDRMHISEKAPVHSGNYLPPPSDHDGIRKFYIRNDSSVNDWSQGESFCLGSPDSKRRGPVLCGNIDTIEDSDRFNLKEIVPDTSLSFLPNNMVPLVGYSLFYLPLLDGDYDNHAFKKSSSAETERMSHIFRAILGDSVSGISIAKEIQLSHCPFFLTIGDFISSIDWDSLDRLNHLGGKFYVPDSKITDNIFDLLKHELLYHAATMTREYDYDDMMWKYRFRHVSSINASDAIQLGFKLDEGKMLPGAPSENHGIGDLYNSIRVSDYDLLISTYGSSYVGYTSRRILKINPSLSQLPDKDDFTGIKFFYYALAIFYREFIQYLSSPTVEQSKGITIIQSLFPVGKEVLVTDSTARRPFTHSLGLDVQPALVTGISYNYARNSGSITYRVGGSSGQSNVSNGYAPACYLDAGNFSKSIGEWSGYPRDHEFTEHGSQAKDVYYFDCLDLGDFENPTPRDCVCGDYAVWAIEVGTYNWTPLPFTCSVDVGTGVITLTGDTTDIDEGEDYVIIFRAYDDLEDCQKFWVMHADDNNTVGTAIVPANRWV